MPPEQPTPDAEDALKNMKNAEAELRRRTGQPESDKASPAVDPREALDKMRALFESLSPSGRIVIRDVYDGEHKLRPALNARAQIACMQEMEKVGIDIGRAQEALQGGMANVVRDIVAAAGSPEVGEALSRCFELAHPKALESARAAAVAADDETPETAKALGAMDLFAIEEIVSALLPFLLRLAIRALDALVTVTERIESDVQ